MQVSIKIEKKKTKIEKDICMKKELDFKHCIFLILFVFAWYKKRT